MATTAAPVPSRPAHAAGARAQVTTFTIIPGDWAPDGDEVTPTMKLKRRPIAEKHAAEFDAMYVQ